MVWGREGERATHYQLSIRAWEQPGTPRLLPISVHVPNTLGRMPNALGLTCKQAQQNFPPRGTMRRHHEFRGHGR